MFHQKLARLEYRSCLDLGANRPRVWDGSSVPAGGWCPIGQWPCSQPTTDRQTNRLTCLTRIVPPVAHCSLHIVGQISCRVISHRQCYLCWKRRGRNRGTASLPSTGDMTIHVPIANNKNVVRSLIWRPRRKTSSHLNSCADCKTVFGWYSEVKKHDSNDFFHIGLIEQIFKNLKPNCYDSSRCYDRNMKAYYTLCIHNIQQPVVQPADTVCIVYRHASLALQWIRERVDTESIICCWNPNNSILLCR